MIQFPFSPVAFKLGSIEVRWYGIFMAVAVIWLIFWAWLQIRRGTKISFDSILTLAIVAIPSGIIFSRLLHVLDDIVIAANEGTTSGFISNPASIIGGEGLTIWGAVLGASLGIWIYCKFKKIKVGYLFDMLAPGIIIAQAIGRVGCLFNGCCPGTYTDLPWGLVYTNPASPLFQTYPTHPAVVYEIIFDVIVFLVLLKLRGKLKPDGAIYVMYISLYSAWRIGIDLLREGTTFLFGLHQSQFIGVVILVVAIPWMIIKMRPAKPELLSPDNIKLTG
jgi:phosphatidylglycerol---prolipoprotein diacylglyceryl transferase